MRTYHGLTLHFTINPDLLFDNPGNLEVMRSARFFIECVSARMIYKHKGLTVRAGLDQVPYDLTVPMRITGEDLTSEIETHLLSAFQDACSAIYGMPELWVSAPDNEKSRVPGRSLRVSRPTGTLRETFYGKAPEDR